LSQHFANLVRKLVGVHPDILGVVEQAAIRPDRRSCNCPTYLYCKRFKAALEFPPCIGATLATTGASVCQGRKRANPGGVDRPRTPPVGAEGLGRRAYRRGDTIPGCAGRTRLGPGLASHGRRGPRGHPRSVSQGGPAGPGRAAVEQKRLAEYRGYLGRRSAQDRTFGPPSGRVRESRLSSEGQGRRERKPWRGGSRTTGIHISFRRVLPQLRVPIRAVPDVGGKRRWVPEFIDENANGSLPRQCAASSADCLYRLVFRLPI